MTRAVERLAGIATMAAVAGAASGVALWATLAAARLGDWPRGTIASLLAAALLLAPMAWMLNVRFALRELAELPETARSLAQRGRPAGPVDAARTYLDVTGSWALLVQLVSPAFWLVTALALVAVVALTAAAMVVTALA